MWPSESETVPLESGCDGEMLTESFWEAEVEGDTDVELRLDCVLDNVGSDSERLCELLGSVGSPEAERDHVTVVDHDVLRSLLGVGLSCMLLVPSTDRDHSEMFVAEMKDVVDAVVERDLVTLSRRVTEAKIVAVSLVTMVMELDSAVPLTLYDVVPERDPVTLRFRRAVTVGVPGVGVGD